MSDTHKPGKTTKHPRHRHAKKRSRTSSFRGIGWPVRVMALVLTATLATQFFMLDKLDTFAATPVHHDLPITERAETYQERQDRITESENPIFAPLEENLGEDTICVSAEFTTLAVVFDAVYESLLPSLPSSMHRDAAAARDAVHRDMENILVSSLALTENPMALGADADDPAARYNSPISQMVVSTLLKIRDGRQNEAIPLANVTLLQAVETVWLYLMVTVIIPARTLIGLVPNAETLGAFGATSPLGDGHSTFMTILNFAMFGGTMGLNLLYSGTLSGLLNSCVAQVTPEQKELAGRPSERTLNISVPEIVTATANQLALADRDTCTPIGDLTLGDILQRTSDDAAAAASTDAEKRRLQVNTAEALAQLRAVRVPQHVIPADPADFNTAESLLSTVAPIAAGIVGLPPISAPLSIVIGLSHNNNQGNDFGDTVPLADLTVTKSLTAAYYTYAFSLWVFQLGLWGTSQFTTIAPPVRWALGVAGSLAALPLAYGLVTYHNVVRSMCFRDLDTTGNGTGAEQNRTDYENGVRTEPPAAPSASTRAHMPAGHGES